MASSIPCMDSVRRAPAAAESDLLDLVHRRIIALRIPGFVAGDEAARLAGLVRASPNRTVYAAEPAVGKLGASFYDSNGRRRAREEYHRRARENTELLRQVCAGPRHPLDPLMECLRTETAAGVCVERVDGRPMSVGICRIFAEGSRLLPHQDILADDAPYAGSPKTLLGQISANVYLQVADEGGEVVVWSGDFTPEQRDAWRLPYRMDFDERLLPPPSAVLRPAAGELIAFETSHIHAVRAVRRGERITFATFIGYRGPGQPWTVWS